MQKNSKARARDVDTAAEGFLSTLLFLRTVFWQDMPFLYRMMPNHPVFNTAIFRTHWQAWRHWQPLAIEFVERIEVIQHGFLCPPFSMAAAGTPEAFGENMLKEVEKYEEELRAKHSWHVSLCSP